MKTYLKKLGADKIDDSEVNESNWPTELIKCIPYLRIVFRSDKVSENGALIVLSFFILLEATSFLVTISSLVMRLPAEFIDDAVTKLCALYEDFSDKKNRKHFGKLYS